MRRGARWFVNDERREFEDGNLDTADEDLVLHQVCRLLVADCNVRGNHRLLLLCYVEHAQPTAALAYGRGAVRDVLRKLNNHAASHVHGDRAVDTNKPARS